MQYTLSLVQVNIIRADDMNHGYIKTITRNGIKLKAWKRDRILYLRRKITHRHTETFSRMSLEPNTGNHREELRFL